jgi:thiol peroxidase
MSVNLKIEYFFNSSRRVIMSQVTVKGGPVSIGGSFPSTGETVKDFNLANNKREDVNLASFGDQRKILNIFPSIDTPTCALSVKRFNDEAANLENTVVLCISADLPFAQKRFCGSEGTDNVQTLSAFRNIEKFATDYGVAIMDSSLQGLTTRAVIVLDEANEVIHSELVAEITEEPNYDMALKSLK